MLALTWPFEWFSSSCAAFSSPIPWVKYAILFGLLTLVCIKIGYMRRDHLAAWRAADRLRSLGIGVSEFPSGLPRRVFKTCLEDVVSLPEYDKCLRRHALVAVNSFDGKPLSNGIFCVTCDIEIRCVYRDGRNTLAALFDSPKRLRLSEVLAALQPCSATLDELHSRLQKSAGQDDEQAFDYRNAPFIPSPSTIVERPSFKGGEVGAAVVLVAAFATYICCDDLIRTTRDAKAVAAFGEFIARHTLKLDEPAYSSCPTLPLGWKKEDIGPDTLTTISDNTEVMAYRIYSYEAKPARLQTCPICKQHAILLHVRVTNSLHNGNHQCWFYGCDIRHDQVGEVCSRCNSWLDTTITQTLSGFPKGVHFTSFLDTIHRHKTFSPSSSQSR